MRPDKGSPLWLSPPSRRRRLRWTIIAVTLLGLLSLAVVFGGSDARF